VDERQTLGAFLTRWLTDVVEPTVRPRTFDSYRMIVNRHLIPALGKLRLAHLTPSDVQSYLHQKRAQGLSPRTVQYHRSVLRTALGQALRWEEVSRNVATLVDPPRSERTEVEPFTLDQITALQTALKGHPLEGVIILALATGMRQGELLGLTWVDVDLDGANVRVRQQLQRIKGKLTLCPLKTDRSRRTLALPAFAVEALRRQRIWQLEARLARGERWQDSDLVFPSGTGAPTDAAGLVHRYHKLLDAAGLPRKPFHTLRHSCASFLLAQGHDLRTIMEQLGHSQISLTANIYSHVAQSLKRQAADSLQELFGA
jgi:integrase